MTKITTKTTWWQAETFVTKESELEQDAVLLRHLLSIWHLKNWWKKQQITCTISPKLSNNISKEAFLNESIPIALDESVFENRLNKIFLKFFACSL